MMSPLFKKLNFKDQKQIFVINAPDEFKPEMKTMRDVTRVSTSLSAATPIEFILAFVTKQKEVDDLAQAIALDLSHDSVVWFVYPKKTSKKYSCEFNRDTGWNELGKLGFEPVRLVAVDENWSALRFRKAEHIKTMTRSSAISDAGKKKIAAGKNRK